MYLNESIFHVHACDSYSIFFIHISKMPTARPWGTYEVIRKQNKETFAVKKIVVYPKSRLSLQSHAHRSEHWIVVSGSGVVTVGEDQIVCGTNTHVFIPRCVKHRVENTSSDDDLVFIEVQMGTVLEEHDIKRYEDDYGRL